MSSTLVFWIAWRGQTGLINAFRAPGRAGLLAGLLLGTSTICFVLSIRHTLVANTLIIVGASPLVAALLSRIFLHEPVARRTWVAIVFALVGIYITVSDNLHQGLFYGDLFALGTACCMGGNLSVVRSVPHLDMTSSIAIGGIFAALAVLPVAAPFSIAPPDVFYLLLLGICVLPISFGLITLGPRYLPAPEVSLLMLLETVVGPLWVWLLLAENPGPRAFAGGALVLFTLGIHSLLGLRRQTRPPVTLST